MSQRRSSMRRRNANDAPSKCFMYAPRSCDKTLGVYFTFGSPEVALSAAAELTDDFGPVATNNGAVMSPPKAKATGSRVRVRFAADSSAKIERVFSDVKTMVEQNNVPLEIGRRSKPEQTDCAAPRAKRPPKPRSEYKPRKKTAKPRKGSDVGATTPDANGIYVFDNEVREVRGGKIVFHKVYASEGKANNAARMLKLARAKGRMGTTAAKPRKAPKKSTTGRTARPAGVPARKGVYIQGRKVTTINGSGTVENYREFGSVAEANEFAVAEQDRTSSSIRATSEKKAPKGGKAKKARKACPKGCKGGKGSKKAKAGKFKPYAAEAGAQNGVSVSGREVRRVKDGMVVFHKKYNTDAKAAAAVRMLKLKHKANSSKGARRLY